MPWCDPCEKNWTPTSLNEDGTCPSCGGAVDGLPEASDGDLEEYKTPWHFWVGLVLVSLYLIWRLIDWISSLF